MVPLRIPPLRERSEDIPELVAHFLGRAEDEALPTKTIEPQAIERLQRYRWPGNVRELENLIRRLLALYSQPVWRARHGNRLFLRRSGPLRYGRFKPFVTEPLPFHHRRSRG